MEWRPGSGNPTDYVGPRGAILNGQLWNDLEPFEEGVVDPEGFGRNT